MLFYLKHVLYMYMVLNTDATGLIYSSVITVKPVLRGHSKKTKNWVFKTDSLLMQVKSIAECSLWGIPQYFQLALSDIGLEKTQVLIFFEWPLKTGFSVLRKRAKHHNWLNNKVASTVYVALL